MHHVNKSRNVSRQFNYRLIARSHLQSVVDSAAGAKRRMVFGAIAAIGIGLAAGLFTMGAGFLVGITLLTANAAIYTVSRLSGGIAAKMLAEMDG